MMRWDPCRLCWGHEAQLGVRQYSQVATAMDTGIQRGYFTSQATCLGAVGLSREWSVVQGAVWAGADRVSEGEHMVPAAAGEAGPGQAAAQSQGQERRPRAGAPHPDALSFSGQVWRAHLAALYLVIWSMPTQLWGEVGISAVPLFVPGWRLSSWGEGLACAEADPGKPFMHVICLLWHESAP